jgi:hypothetical protein
MRSIVITLSCKNSVNHDFNGNNNCNFINNNKYKFNGDDSNYFN